jgi:hypothetical protein
MELLGCRHVQNSLRKKRLKKLNGGLALLPDLAKAYRPLRPSHQHREAAARFEQFLQR